MITNRKNLIHSQMKRLEEMSREELIEEAISNSKRLEEIEAARKNEERMIAELEKQVELLEKVKELVSNGEPEMGKAIPYLQEVFHMEEKKITELRKEIDEMEKGCPSQRDSHSLS